MIEASPSLPVELGSAAWPELTGAPLVLLPLGSTEQHGPHLPLHTDTALALAVARLAVRRLPGALLAPALPYGASGEHEGFPGTVSIGTEVLTAVLVEHGRSICRWAGRLLVVNGHGGNLDALRSAVPALRAEGRDVAWSPCGVPGGDAHAGRTETSLMLHVEPGSVRAGLASPGVRTPLAELLPRLRSEGVRGVSPSGVLGDPTGASAAEGARLLASMVDRLVSQATHWHPDPTGRLAPLP